MENLDMVANPQDVAKVLSLGKHRIEKMCSECERYTIACAVAFVLTLGFSVVFGYASTYVIAGYFLSRLNTWGGRAIYSWKLRKIMVQIEVISDKLRLDLNDPKPPDDEGR